MTNSEFQELVWEQGRVLYRDMPWRRDTQPYYVLVSEIMLQQTQVERVVPKFEAFIARFPDIEELAAAPLADVLVAWSGLGYNRRAKFLHEAAKKIMHDYAGVFPDTFEQLITLPGVGANTAGAVLAYSFNVGRPFIETNVRTVYFHHYFADTALVSDKELRELVADTLDREHPREWYWALMDYGSYLKRQGVGKIDKSKHYKKQTALKGSVREVRGAIIKALTGAPYNEADLKDCLAADERFAVALAGLLHDGLISKHPDGTLHLAA